MRVVVDGAGGGRLAALTFLGCFSFWRFLLSGSVCDAGERALRRDTDAINVKRTDWSRPILLPDGGFVVAGAGFSCKGSSTAVAEVKLERTEVDLEDFMEATGPLDAESRFKKDEVRRFRWVLS